jgi:6-phosphogluconolactonase (cycloisomerase 2 family)
MDSRTTLTRDFVVLGIASFALLAGCAGGTSQSLNHPIPTPTIATVSPNSAVAGGAPFTLTIFGTNFVAASTVNFGGAAPATTFVTANQLTAAIPTAAIGSGRTAAVTVTNPGPGGGTSNAVNFTISTTSPVPTINSLFPSCAPFAGQDFTLSVDGLNFLASSVVRWNGSDRPTFFNPGLVAQIPASDIAAAGTAKVTVFNPAPGGGSSNTLTFTITPGGVGPESVAVDPTGKFAFVANEGCTDVSADNPGGNVSMYSINATTGALTSIGSQVTAGFCANSVAVDSFGKFAYVANEGCGDTSGGVSVYAINPTSGALTSKGDAPCAAGSCLAPFSVAVHPSGKFAYVANEGGFSPTSISMYTIDPTTGNLNLIGTVAAGGRAVAVSVDPTGKFAYAATVSDPPGSPGNMSAYAINANSGALTSVGTIPAGTDPASVAEDPTGKIAYVTNSGSNDVSIYTINTTNGALTSVGTVATGTKPVSVAVDPTGKFACVANSGSNDVSMYTIDGTTGALTSIGTIAAGLFPTSITIHPSGKFAYVTNSGSNSVSMYSIDPATGALSLIGTVGT